MDKKYRESISKEEINELPQAAFGGEIVVVESEEAVASACDYLSGCAVIGFDTETRPKFAPGPCNKVALLQLSSAERAFLFRLNKIPLDKPIIRLLEARSPIKVGAAVRDDVKALQRLRHFTPRGFVELQSMMKDFGIAELSLRKMAGIILGIKISKAQRLSNWEARTLTPAQQLYAATDAWVGRALYVELTDCE